MCFLRNAVKFGLVAAGAAALIAWRGDASAPEAAPPMRVAKSTKKTPAPADKEKPAMLVGDASLQGSIDLTKAVETDGRYEVRLDDGRRAVLTLDPEWQRAAEAVLDRAKARSGAVVVLATDGRILALAGRTEEGADDFALPVTVWAPAASVFKIVTAAALVDEGVDPDGEVCFHGGLRSVDESHLKDDPKRDKTCKDLAYAVAKSQNAIIGKLAHAHLDRKRLASAAADFGFGDAPQFALAADAPVADIPDGGLELARAAAGFWHTELSPLGGALVANTVASGGFEVTPRIVASVIDRGGEETPVVGEAPRRAVDAEVAAEVAEMMVGTTDYGTARDGFRDRRGRRFMADIQVAGKTGSLSESKPKYIGYSWFVGFAPAEEPEVAIAVLLGNPPRWHLKAHTAARLVLDRVF